MGKRQEEEEEEGWRIRGIMCMVGGVISSNEEQRLQTDEQKNNQTNKEKNSNDKRNADVRSEEPV